MEITINFDMDGTLASLYTVENWLDKLIANDESPYMDAKPMFRQSALVRVLNRLQRNGYRLAIISWLSKSGTEAYNEKVAETKKAQLAKHLPSVRWDEITIVPYGTPKENYSHTAWDILFDDEEKNRENWIGDAYDVENIMEVLRNL